MKVTGWMEGGALLGLALLLFLYPAVCVQGAREGLILCRDLLIPTLFPFFVLSSLLISTGLAGRLVDPMARILRPLLGVGGPGTAALLLGLVGGYPAGLRALADLRARGDCSKAEARRAALFCNNCGPAFFLGAAGAGVFGSRQAGGLLLLANALAAVALAGGLRLFFGPAGGDMPLQKSSRASLSSAFPDCVAGAFSASLGLCGYVVFFSVLTALAARTGVLSLCQDLLSGLFPGPQGDALARSLAVGLLEISTGTAALQEAAGTAAALPLSAFLLGWGGLSVHGQSLPFLRQVGGRTGPYLLAKLLHGLLAAGIVLLLFRLFPLSLPAMARPGPFLSPTLAGRETAALWLLSGGYSFLFRKKEVEKNAEGRYNGGRMPE